MLGYEGQIRTSKLMSDFKVYLEEILRSPTVPEAYMITCAAGVRISVVDTTEIKDVADQRRRLETDQESGLDGASPGLL